VRARRGFLKGLALGCTAALGWRTWPRTPDPAMELAQRVVRALGTVAPPLRIATTRSIEQLLSTVFGPMTTLAELARLSTTQLQQLLAERIQQDYQKGALVQHQGWWLADSEAAILELDCRLAERRGKLATSPSAPAATSSSGPA
jgi:hypothetical protein